MKVYRYLFIIVLIISFSCSAKRETAEKIDKDDIELNYIHYFTEGTKHSLLGNYKLAVQLYNKCIQLKPESNAPYYQLSNIYMKAGDIQNAVAYAEKAFENDDTNIWYALHLANLYQYTKENTKAIKVYERIVELDPEEEYYYNLALLYTRDGNYENALNVIDSLNIELKNSKEILLLRHNIYSKKGEKDNAVNELEKLIKFFPENYENYGLLAEYLTEIGRNKYAQEIYWKLNKLMPNSGLVDISYGDFLLHQKHDKDSAYFYYKKSLLTDDISLDDKVNLIYSIVESYKSYDSIFVIEMINTYKDNFGNDDRIYTVSADYFIKNADYKTARDELETYISLNENNEIVWEQFLLLDNFLGNDSVLYQNCERAIEIFPEKSNFILFKAFAEYGLELYDSCIITCSKGLSITTDQDEKLQFYTLLADAHRENKNYKTSDLYYEKIIEEDPKNMMIKNNYSYYLSLREEKLEKAEKYSAETIRREPENATYLDTYGWILFKLGKYDDALKYIQTAIKYGANENAEVLDHYGDIMVKLNRCKEAIEAWNEAKKYSGASTDIDRKIEEWNAKCKE